MDRATAHGLIIAKAQEQGLALGQCTIVERTDPGDGDRLWLLTAPDGTELREHFDPTQLTTLAVYH